MELWSMYARIETALSWVDVISRFQLQVHETCQ